MTAPDATSPFERACAAYYASLHEADAASWDDVGDNVQYIIRRGFAAGLRELRDNPGGVQAAQRDACVGMEWPGSPDKMRDAVELAQWQAPLDAILKDAPE